MHTGIEENGAAVSGFAYGDLCRYLDHGDGCLGTGRIRIIEGDLQVLISM